VKRSNGFILALAGFGGMLLLTGASKGQAPGGAAPAGGAPPAANTGRPVIAVFNMAAVMREFGQAKYQVHTLNEKRKSLSAQVVAWRAEYVKIQEELPKIQVPALRDEMAKKMLDLSRKIQDEESRINKTLNDEASAIISKLYDQIKTVVDKTAEMNGYHIVFAYPDAVTEKEINDPMVKELKLKPPAAQPFFVAKHVDLTGVVVQTLNAWFPPVDAQGKPVDVSKLNTEPAAPAGTAPAGTKLPGQP
jgi:Skp family chaperone for outer membrane proteins